MVCPYSREQWSLVRKAWWWHIVAMLFLAPIYSIVALTAWQAPSRQRVGRRIVWSTALTLGAFVLVGLPAFVVFSRRWYWLWRTRADLASTGVAAAAPDASRGYMDWIAVGGATLADRLTGANRGPMPSPPPQDRWAALVDEASGLVSRIAVAAARSSGAAGPSIQSAEKEARAAAEAVRQVAGHARQIEGARASMDTARINARLADLESGRGSPEDLEAARRSLQEQLAAANRMEHNVERLEGQLHRMCAQLGEAAVRAEELALCPPGSIAAPTDLTSAVDRLHAIRLALESVDTGSAGPATA